MEKVLKKYPNNPLLIPEEIGRPKKSTRRLPPETHAYGKCDKKDAEGAQISKVNTNIFSHLFMG